MEREFRSARQRKVCQRQPCSIWHDWGDDFHGKVFWVGSGPHRVATKAPLVDGRPKQQADNHFQLVARCEGDEKWDWWCACRTGGMQLPLLLPCFVAPGCCEVGKRCREQPSSAFPIDPVACPTSSSSLKEVRLMQPTPARRLISHPPNRKALSRWICLGVDLAFDHQSHYRRAENA